MKFPDFYDFQLSIKEEQYDEICEHADYISKHNQTDHINHYIFVTEILHLYHDWLAEQLSEQQLKIDNDEKD